MKTKEVEKWKAFEHPDGTIRDLSFLDAHEVIYTHYAAGKPDKVYRFYVTYSFHCFCKEYENQTEEVRNALMYFAPKDQRPFCDRRYKLAKLHLRKLIEDLGNRKVLHAGYGSYAVVELEGENGESVFYFVVFTTFKEKKRLRLHVTSAYPVSKKPGGHYVGFFTIANNMLSGRQPPHAPK